MTPAASRGSAGVHRELIRRLHRTLLDSRDPGTVDSFFAQDFLSHNNPPGFPAGAQGVKQFFATFRDAFPDAHVRIDQVVEEGDWVAVATTLTGTHRGEVMGIAPTGAEVAVTGIDMVRVENGLIVEHRGLTDTVGLMRQLGEATG